MKIEFLEGNKKFDDIQLALNELAFEHFPITIDIEGVTKKIDNFCDAENFVKTAVKHTLNTLENL